MKYLALMIIAIVCLSGGARAGMLTLSANASIYNPPEEGANPSLMYGFSLDYDINKYLHARAGASYTSYTANGVDYTLMPITFDLIAHFLPDGPIDPYLGGGLGYYSKTKDGREWGSTGGQGVAGVKVKISSFWAGIEANYMDNDLYDSAPGTVGWGGWASGTTYVFVPF